MSTITVRPATPGDFPAHRDGCGGHRPRTRSGHGSDPAYLAYLLEHGHACWSPGGDGAITGFGASRLIGEGPARGQHAV